MPKDLPPAQHLGDLRSSRAERLQQLHLPWMSANPSSLTVELDGVSIVVEVTRGDSSCSVQVRAQDPVLEVGGSTTLTLNPEEWTVVAPFVYTEVPDRLLPLQNSLETISGHSPRSRILSASNLGLADATRKGTADRAPDLDFDGAQLRCHAILRSATGRAAYTRRASTRDSLLSSGPERDSTVHRSFPSQAECRAYFDGAGVPFPVEH